jgi:hypothetical protein
VTAQTIAKFCVLTAGIATLPGVSHGAKDMKTDPEVVGEKASGVNGAVGTSIVSQHVSRGVVFEDQGRILQPYADLFFKIYEGDGFLNKVTIGSGIWNSFHSRKTAVGLVSGMTTSTTSSWFEFDFTTGVSFTFAKNFTFSPSYYTYLSPNDAFATFQGLNLKLAYDDTALPLVRFALRPYVQVLFELANKAGTGANQGIYYELGCAPGFPLGPARLTFPIALGLGSNDFYGQVDTNTGTVRDKGFGFFSAGVIASAVVPGTHGAWTARAGYTYYRLGAGTSDFNTAARGSTIRDRKNNENVFSGGIDFAF